MKYKAGDKVRIKSLDWYTSNKNRLGEVWTESLDGESQICFDRDMIRYCGMETVIFSVERKNYVLKGIPYAWTDEMIEGLVEEETKPNIIEEAKTYWDSIKDAWICPQGYQFKDENGNVINAQKIVLEKKKNEYPKTYEECCVDLGLKVCPKVNVSIGDTPTYREHIVETFIELLACRDAYLKRYEIEMRLNSRWTPDYEDLNTTKFCITTSRDKVIKVESSVQNYVLAFPTAEMRDAFYMNFESEIERCKELL